MPSMPETASTAVAHRRTAATATGLPARPTGLAEVGCRATRTATDRFRLQPAPDREPPFDDEATPRRLNLVGACDQPLPFGMPRSAPLRLRLAEGRAGPAPAEQDGLPDPGGFARRFAIAVIEAATGRRAASQLSPHTSPGVQAGLARDAGRIGRLGTATRPATLHSLHLAEPADGVIEAAVIVQVGPRYRAIAFRLEGAQGHWRCVRLQIG